jgi:hypothetical protein
MARAFSEIQMICPSRRRMGIRNFRHSRLLHAARELVATAWLNVDLLPDIGDGIRQFIGRL